MMRKILLFLIIIMGSCYHDLKEPSFDMNKVIPADTMVSVLTDFQLLEGAFILQERQGLAIDKRSSVYTDQVLRKHNITNEAFKESMRYYTYYVDELDKIYEQVVINLSKLESEVNKK